MKENQKFSPRDIAIGAVAACLLCVLVFLFLRRDLPLHQWVFGDHGPETSAATRADAPESAKIPGDRAGEGDAVPRNSRGSVSGTVPAQPSSVSDGEASGSTVATLNGSTPAPSADGIDGPAGSNSGIPDSSLSALKVSPASGLPEGSSLPSAPSLPGETTRFPSSTTATPGQPSTGGGIAGSGTDGTAAHPANLNPANPGSGSGIASTSASSPVSNPTQSSSIPGQGQTPAVSSGATPAQPPVRVGGNPGQPGTPSARTVPQRAAIPGSLSAGPSASPASARGATDGNAADSAPGPGAAPTEVAKEGTEDLLQLAKNATPPADLSLSKLAGNAAQSPTAANLPGTGDALSQPQPKSDSGDKQPPSSDSAPAGDSTPASLPGGNSSAGDGLQNAGKGETENDKPKDDHQLFEPQRGTNVVFVLDRSLSMRGEKSLRARSELVNTLEHLGTNKSFYVIFFPFKPMPARGPLPATPENVQSVTNWILTLGHAFGSDPTKSLERGLELSPDTLWLLSDGKFSPKIPELIRTSNASLHARIHTIGFYERDGEAILRQIADQNHGTYRFVGPLTNSASFGTATDTR